MTNERFAIRRWLQERMRDPSLGADILARSSLPDS
jgi:hypothetical protein